MGGICCVLAKYLSHLLPNTVVFAVAGLMFCTIGAAFRALRKAMSADGIYMVFIAQMDKRHFQWDSFRCSVCMTWCVIVGVWLAAIIIIDGSALSGQHVFVVHFLPEGDSKDIQTASVIMISLFALAHIMLLFTTLATAGSVWLVYFFCALHMHDIRSFREVVSLALETNDEPEDWLDGLMKLEVTVSARFRHASETWVRFVVSSLFLVLTVAVTILTVLFLKGSTSPLPMICLHCLFLLLCALLVFALSFPLAQVAETFEFDLLRPLNTPVILHNSQKYLGDQLMTHLRALAWGFRCGGSIINANRVAGMLSGLVLGIVAAVSQALVERFAEV